MLATGHQVVSSVTTREMIMTVITPTKPRLAPIKATLFRDVVIPVFQAAMPIMSLTIGNLPILMNYWALSNLLPSATFV